MLGLLADILLSRCGNYWNSGALRIPIEHCCTLSRIFAFHPFVAHQPHILLLCPNICPHDRQHFTS